MAGKKKYFPNFHLPEGQNIDRGRMMVKEKNSDGRDSLPGRCKNRSRMSRGSNPAQTKGDEESNIGKRDLDTAVELRPAAFTLPATILLTTQKELLEAASGHSQAASVSGDCAKQGGVEEKKQKPASFPIRNWAKFVFIRANRGKQPKWMANTHAHTAGSSLGACKHTPVIQQHAGKQGKRRGHTQQTTARVKCMTGFSRFFLLRKIKMHNLLKAVLVLSSCW